MNISVLEIVLYSAIGLFVIIYITHGVIQMIKKKRNTQKEEKKDDDED